MNDAIDVTSMPSTPIKADSREENLPLRGMDILTLEKLLEREYHIPPADLQVVSYYSQPSHMNQTAKSVRGLLQST
jgi:hypothetical protein